ncbi:zinc-ribbon domain-containing protein [Sorangium sp. So ce542]|uniref:zinc-ribbon domain-containing protein n=1 Tax=Sorangium sp. So ce542 TaxID=3133316 RepID=UPI003F63F049
MKITCESCQAKYTIADEKVVGKTVKIKCKKCNHAMVVHGASEAASAPSQDATVGQQGDLAEDADAKLVAEPSGAPSTAAPDAWTVNVAEGDERTMTTAELVTEYARGALSNDTYVWKEGMSDWLPIASVPELKERFSSREDAAPAADAAAAAVATPAAAAVAAAVPAPAVAPAAAAVPTPAAVPAAAAAPVPVAPAPAGLRFGPEGTVVMKDAKRAPVPAASAGAAAAASAGAAAAAPAAGAAAAAPAAGAAAGAPAAGAAAATPAADGGAAAGAPAAAAPAAAARRPGRAAAVDVFSAAAADRATEPAPSAPPPGGDRQVGERNENSVLFSLSALTATENAAKQKQEETPSGRRISSRPAKNNGRTGYDDLLNLGGGAIASAPMLAPPPLLAPVADSRPPPSLSASAKSSVPPPPLLPLSPMAAPEPSAKKGGMGLIAAAVAAVVLIGGVAFFFMQSPKEDTSTTTPEQTNAAPAEAPSPAETPAPAPTPTETAAAATPPPTETAAPAAEEPAASAAAPDQPAPSAAADKPAEKERPSSAPVAAADKPAAAADKPAASKPAADPAPSGGGGEFNRGAASSALGAAAGSAKSCKKAGGPTGTGKVKVTFAPSGNVTSAEVQGAPFAGTSVGGCVARLFRGARVPAFGGGPVSVSKSFTIN